MKQKPVRLRPGATGDAFDAVDYYEAEAGSSVASRFAEELQVSIQRLSTNPAIGSQGLGERLRIKGLRTLLIKGFPYLICYFVTPDHVDIWRILHGARDLGGVLAAPSDKA